MKKLKLFALAALALVGYAGVANERSRRNDVSSG